MNSASHSAELVSIVMPSFNQARFIEESVRSVLDQDYPRLELIVADGGSTDHTIDVLTRLARQDKRLRWFSEPDDGAAEAINKALARVRGTLIGWLNSDDLYMPGAISRAVASLSSSEDWVMVYGHGNHVDEHGTVLGLYPTSSPDTPLAAFRDGCFICQPTVFFKRTLNVLLGPLDTNLRAAFDFDYWLRAFCAFPGRIGFVDTVQACSRLHDQCITSRMRRTVALEGVKVIASHLGAPPRHWVLTYLEELLRMPEQSRPKGNLRDHMLATANELMSCFDDREFELLCLTLERDERLLPGYAEGMASADRPHAGGTSPLASAGYNPSF